jgi:hypothetical protein
MKLAFKKIDTLPRMAWCARVDKLHHTIRILHGSYVEVSNEFFCEGAWSGNFISGDFESNLLMGSGGKVTDRGPLISTPNHTMERIYALKNEHAMFISNSCAFVFAQSHDEPDPHYLLYASKIASIIYGLQKYARALPTRNGNHIQMFCHCNLYVGVDHQLIESPKTPVREFVDFADYKSFLEEKIRAIVINANDANRRVHYRPIATISSGYDSPASAVLAQKVGCDEALTFEHARPHRTADLDDSGAKIAKRLGMKVKVYDRFDYLNRTGFPEAEGGISEFLCFADALDRRLLFTGFNDAVWDPFNKTVSPFIQRKDTSGNSLAELRLRVGFVHLPVPYVGCTSHPSIHRISTAKAMQPWSVGTKYDKPIPRRLVEEAGVERGMFGLEKKAVAIVPEAEGFEKAMTKASFTDFSRFVQEHYTVQMAAKLRLYRLGQCLARIHRALKQKLVVIISPIIGKRITVVSSPQTGLERVVRWGPYSLLFHWSIHKLLSRYEVNTNEEHYT